jgi:protein transport protein SEC24
MQKYVDAAQHAEWPRMTGGSLYLYHSFTPHLDHQEVVNDLLWNVQREQGLECVMRVRCSQGVDVGAQYGSFFRRETGATY